MLQIKYVKYRQRYIIINTIKRNECIKCELHEQIAGGYFRNFFLEIIK